MHTLQINPGFYNNIMELAKNNNLLDDWNKETSNFEDYLDDYADRNIVQAWLSDMLYDTGIKCTINDKWEKGIYNWRESSITIL